VITETLTYKLRQIFPKANTRIERYMSGKIIIQEAIGKFFFGLFTDYKLIAYRDKNNWWHTDNKDLANKIAEVLEANVELHGWLNYPD